MGACRGLFEAPCGQFSNLASLQGALDMRGRRSTGTQTGTLHVGDFRSVSQYWKKPHPKDSLKQGTDGQSMSVKCSRFSRSPKLSALRCSKGPPDPGYMDPVCGVGNVSQLLPALIWGRPGSHPACVKARADRALGMVWQSKREGCSFGLPRTLQSQLWMHWQRL